MIKVHLKNNNTKEVNLGTTLFDLAKNLGEEVHSAYEGTVVFAGYNNGGYGNLIVIQHGNNMKTYYAHLNEIYVNVGDMVEAGALLATMN